MADHIIEFLTGSGLLDSLQMGFHRVDMGACIIRRRGTKVSCSTAHWPGSHTLTISPRRVNRVMLGLWFTKSCTTQALCKRLVEALVVLHLDYCRFMYLNVSQKLRIRLQRLSNNGVNNIIYRRKECPCHPFREISQVSEICLKEIVLYCNHRVQV